MRGHVLVAQAKMTRALDAPKSAVGSETAPRFNYLSGNAFELRTDVLNIVLTRRG